MTQPRADRAPRHSRRTFRPKHSTRRRPMNNLIDAARHLPIPEATPTVSINPVTLPAPGRGLPLEMRITAPIAGRDLPILLLSHGHGPSLYLPSKDGYGPLASFYAAHGFAVIQPTHVNSKVAGLSPDAPGGPLFWRSRVEDMMRILDGLDAIEASAPAIAGRLDRSRVVAVGHSLGGQTVGMLLGARLTDPKDEAATDVSLIEPRITAGVLLAAPGNGGADLSATAAEHYSALNPDFSHPRDPDARRRRRRGRVAAPDRPRGGLARGRLPPRPRQRLPADGHRRQARARRRRGLRRARDGRRGPGAPRRRAAHDVGLPALGALRRRPGMGRGARGARRARQRAGHCRVQVGAPGAGDPAGRDVRPATSPPPV